jgi:FADH2 O2-dependent halogenase
LLEELATRYGLPRLLPLCKWGPWQRTYPEIGCGLKRGFSFFHHRRGEAWAPTAGRDNELLVAASPNDEIADTQWYRPDFDHFLVAEAQATGVEYLDETNLGSVEFHGEGAALAGIRQGREVRINARFVVDASGPRGFLVRQLGLGERALPTFPPRQALFTHFRGVRTWEDTVGCQIGAPFPPDAAALHHVFEGGWMWVLRFNNGITSAGVSVSDAMAAEINLADDAPAWDRLLRRLPSVAAQFAEATPIKPFIHAPRLAFRAGQLVGERWALLPSAAGFVDPLFSTGFVLNLLGIERLAAALASGAVPTAAALEDYAAETDGDLVATSRLLGAQHAVLGDPERFNLLTMLYFAAASFAETTRRLGRTPTEGFLLRRRPGFGPEALALADAVVANPGLALPELRRRVADLVGAINVAGLLHEAKRNWYPCDAADLLAAADKVPATTDALRNMLRRVGFGLG